MFLFLASSIYHSIHITFWSSPRLSSARSQADKQAKFVPERFFISAVLRVIVFNGFTFIPMSIFIHNYIFFQHFSLPSVFPLRVELLWDTSCSIRAGMLTPPTQFSRMLRHLHSFQGCYAIHTVFKEITPSTQFLRLLRHPHCLQGCCAIHTKFPATRSVEVQLSTPGACPHPVSGLVRKPLLVIRSSPLVMLLCSGFLVLEDFELV